MKHRIILMLFALILPLASVTGQNIALGERVPEIKTAVWLNGRKPSAAPLTYIEFFHSSGNAGIQALDRLKALIAQSGSKLHVIVVTREEASKVAQLLTPYLSESVSVAIDPSGKIFAAFGVTYLPFGVLTDAKNRALWMGNTLQLPKEKIK